MSTRNQGRLRAAAIGVDFYYEAPELGRVDEFDQAEAGGEADD